MQKEKKEYKYFTKAINLGDGKRKYIRGKTKRELDRKVMQYYVSIGKGNMHDIVDSDMTVGELAELWLEKSKRPTVRPQTYDLYRARIEYHLYPSIGDMRLCDVRAIHIIDAVNSHGYGAKEANKGFLSTVRAVFQFAVDNNLLAKSPVPKRMSVSGAPGRTEKPLTPEQTTALLKACRENKDPNVYLFTKLALVTGMRRGEIAALRWDCVDFDNGFIYVRRNHIGSTDEVVEELKTEAARRDIPISAETVALLRQARAASTSTYVVSGLTNGHLSSVDMARYSRAWNRPGIANEPVHAHLLRKTFATRLIESGTDPKRVQYLLGHTTLEMTLGIYAKYDAESQAENTRSQISKIFDRYA